MPAEPWKGPARWRPERKPTVAEVEEAKRAISRLLYDAALEQIRRERALEPTDAPPPPVAPKPTLTDDDLRKRPRYNPRRRPRA